jgi:proline dehydrogenase
VTTPLGRSVLAVTGHSRIRKIFTETRAGRALSTRFVAGESIGEAIAVAGSLNAAGATVSLDHLGEHVTTAAEAELARDDYLACLDEIAAAGIDGNISVKLTQLGLGSDDALARASLGALAARAAAVGTTVTVDMEESVHTETTIRIFEEAQASHGNLGLALQAYLRRTPADLERLEAAGGHVRLCKGAYAEPAELAAQTRADVNAAFDALLGRLMASETLTPAIATHDETRIGLAQLLGAARDGPWEFQMLYGVRSKLQSQLLRDGYRLRIYVPYGIAWYPYLTRRLAERPANLWFFLRALLGR